VKEWVTMNIFMVLCDELRADSLGYMGNEIIKTPNIDELSADSVSFEQSYCNSPMCVPSRVSLATGRHALSHGAIDNLLRPFDDELSLYQILQDQGYQTANFGKWHSNIEPEKFGMQVSNTLEQETDDLERKISCFGIDDKKSRLSSNYKKNNGDISLIVSGTRPTHKDQTLDTFVTKQYLSYLDKVKDNGKPIFARLSILDPHTPYLPAEPYASMYDPAVLPMPSSMEDSLTNKPILQQYFRQVRGFGEFDESDFRKSKASYYGLVSHVDERIGLFVEHLKSQGLYDDSLIIFTSDHGSMLGEHGFVEKWGYMYDQVIRTPLLIKMPGNQYAGTRKTDMVESIDLMPTILDLLSRDIPDNVQGKSLLPYIRGKADSHKQRVYAQYYCGSLQNTPALMVRDKKWKLTSYPEGHQLEDFLTQDHPLKMSSFFDGEEFLGELYNLQEDPEERFNLFNDSMHTDIRNQYLAYLDEWVESLGVVCETKTNPTRNLFGSYISMQGENSNKARQMFDGVSKLSQLEKRSTKFNSNTPNKLRE
jgi:arylsulfatase A-like enzyme